MDSLLLARCIGTYFGVHYTGDTAENRGQCVGLIEVWIDANKRPHIVGNAVDLLANAPVASYTRIDNTPTNFPVAGDIVCWDATWGGGFGHTAIVVAADELALGVFEQNNPENSPPVLATHSYDGVTGWLRFK